jgi:type 1 glutamine amidotransferase
MKGNVMRRLLRTLLHLTIGLTLLSTNRPGWGQREVSPEAEARIVQALPDQALASPQQPRRVLIFTRTLGFRHGSIPTGVKAFQMMGRKTGAYQAVHSEDPAMFDQENLEQFDAVVMLNTTGDCFAPESGRLNDQQEATLERRKANFERFVSQGKGVMGVHSASDTFYSWKEYGDMIGAWFTSHPWHTDVTLKVDSPNHPLTSMFDAASGFQVKDEIYMFAPRSNSSAHDGYQPYSRSKLRVLLSLDAGKFDVSRGDRPDDDYGISWIRQWGDGRVFYTVLGHNDHIFWDPVVLTHYLAGLQYVLGDLQADATPSAAEGESGRAASDSNEQAASDGDDQSAYRPLSSRDLSQWQLKADQGSHWTVGRARLDPNDPSQLQVNSSRGRQLINAQPQGVDIFTARDFGDVTLRLELMVPKGSNSGVYLMGNYEIQVLDSFGKERVGPGDIGGIYGAAAPRTNAAKEPGEWQTMEIVFQAPRFNDQGEKTANARFEKVVLNGQIIHQDVEVTEPTGGNLGRGEGPKGPLMFQGDHGAVAYRNIEIIENNQE